MREFLLTESRRTWPAELVHPDGRRELVRLVEKYTPEGWTHTDTLTGPAAYRRTSPAEWHNIMHLACNRELLAELQAGQRAEQQARAEKAAKPRTRRGTR